MKTRKTSYRSAGLLIKLLTGVSILSPGVALANPVDGVVSGGSATISNSGNTTDITQTTDRAIIDWRGFDIGAGETTVFHQPSATSITLNRINSGNPTQILGTLSANGNVVLINPSGIFFGSGSKVDVSGLIATTADIKNENFMNGDFKFDIPGHADAAIINEGTITAKQAGLVGLVAPNVINRGVITANLGRIELASGDTATVDLYGDGLMEVALSDNVRSQLVQNTGTLQANGGKIALTAAAGNQIVNSLIDVKGEVKAASIENKNGEIIISNAQPKNITDVAASAAARKVNIEGSITAKGETAGSKGGSVKVFADSIIMQSGSLIDVSGFAGGGTALIGGDEHGITENFANAYSTSINQGATIKANALDSGNGGKIIVWSDNNTEFNGSIEGKGGINGGDGGFAETSGENVSITGSMNLSAPTENSLGSHAGTWLIDPTNITIYGAGTAGTDNTNTFTVDYLESYSIFQNINLTASSNITLDMNNSGSTDSVLDVASNHNITLTATSGSISSNSDGTINTSGTGSITLIAGTDITFANNLGLTANGTGGVTLQANGNIIYSGGGDITTTGGAIVLNSDRDQATASGGYIWLQSGTLLTSHGGNITLGGGTDPTTMAATGTGSANGIELDSAYLDASGTASGGIIKLVGKGSPTTTSTSNSGGNGIYFSDGDITTNFSGTITLTGTGGGTTSAQNKYGIIFKDGTAITAQNGDITVNGTGGTASLGGNVGLVFSTAGMNVIQSNGTGNIYLTGTGTNSGSSGNHGIWFNSTVAGSGVFSTNGTISLTGVVGNGSSSYGMQFTGNNTAALGGVSDTKDISIITDSISGRLSSIQTSGNVKITPNTALAINIGGSTGFALPTTFLDAITAGMIVIGNSTFDNAITTSAYTWKSPVSLVTRNADINIIGAQTMNTYSFLAQTYGTGNIVFNTGSISSSATGTAVSLISNSAITTTGTNSISSTAGTVSETSVGNMSLTPITATGFTGTVTGSGSTITTSTINVGSSGGSITLVADDLTIGGDLTGSGTGSTLSIRTNDTTRTICVGSAAGGGYCGSGFLGLNTTELGHFVNGWSSIVIGNNASTGTLEIGGASFSDPISFRNNFRTQIDGDITGTDDASISFYLNTTGYINFYSASTITTAAHDFYLTGGGNFNLRSNTTINTSGGNVSFIPTSTNGFNFSASNTFSSTLIINASSGTVTLPKMANLNTTYFPSFTITGGTINLGTTAFGGTYGMGNVTLTSVNSLTLPDFTTVAGKNFSATVTGTGKSITTGAINVGTNGNISLVGGDLTIGGALTGTGGLTISTNGTMGIGDGASGTLTLSNAELNNITHGWSMITFGSGIYIADMDVRSYAFADTVSFANTTGDINFNGTLSSAGGIFVEAGNNNINVNSGASVTSTTSNVLFQTDAADINVRGSVTGVVVAMAASGVIGLNNGSITATGDDNNFGGDNILLLAQQINLAGSNNLTASSDADPVTGSYYNVDIAAPVDGNGNLTIHGGNVVFGGDLGSYLPVGNINITSVASLTLPKIITVAGKTVSATVTGAGNSITTGDTINVGTGGNITFVADDLVFGSNALTGTGTITLSPYSSSRVININTGANDGSDFNLSSAEIADLTTGWSSLVIGSNTSNGGINDPSITYNSSVTLLQNNGDINISDDITMGANSFTAQTTGTGKINFNGTSSITSTATGSAISLLSATTINLNADVTLTANSGTINFAGNVVGGSTLTASANAMTFNGDWGTSGSPLFQVQLTSVSSLTLPSNIYAAIIQITTTGTGSKITTGNIINGINGALTLTSDDIAINGDISGTGSLQLSTYSSARDLNINTGPNDGSDYNLGAAELAHMVAGWGSVYIEQAFGSSGNVNVAASTWANSIGLYSYNGNLNITGLQTMGANNFSASASGTGSVIFNNGGVTTTSTSSSAISISSFTLTGVNTLTANSGTILITSNVNGAGDLTASANSFLMFGTWGGTTALGNISLTSATNLTLPTLTTAAGKTFSATVTGAGNKITDTHAINVGTGGNITLTADDMAFSGSASFTGTGTITLQPYATNRPMGINYLSSDGTNLNLTTTEIGYITNGWGNIKIGRSDAVSGAYIDAAGTTWNDPTTFYGFATRIRGTIAGQDDASLTFAGTIRSEFDSVGAAVTTQGKDITFNGYSLQSSSSSINSNGGNITVSKSITNQLTSSVTHSVTSGGGNISIGDGTNSIIVGSGALTSGTLTFNAGAGSLTFSGGLNNVSDISATGATINLAGAWGNSTAIGNATFSATNSLTLTAITTQAGKTVSATVTGAGNSITTGAINVGASGNITLTADDLTIGGALTGTGNVTLQPNSTSQVTCINFTGSGCNSGSYFALSTGELSNLTDGWSNIYIGNINDTAQMYIGDTSWTDPVTFQNKYRMLMTGNLTSTDSVYTATTGGVGFINVQGNITLTTAGKVVDFSATSAGAYGGVITTNNGNITFKTVSFTTGRTGLTVNSNGGNISFTSTAKNFADNGDTTGQLLTLNSGTGSVSFAATGDTLADISVTGNSITFNGAWGGTTNIGNLTFVSVNSLTLPAITTQAGKTVSATVTGAGNSITDANAINVGTGGNITLTADDVVFTSGASFTGTGTLTIQPNDTTETVCIGTVTCSGSYLGLDTTEIGYFTNGWSNIYLDRFDSTGTLQIGTSSWTDTVTFRNGAKTELKSSLTGTDDASITIDTTGSNAGYLNINGTSATITTAGHDITLNMGNFVRLNTSSGTVGLTSNNGNIYITKELDYSSAATLDGTLTINAGTGTISLPKIINQSSNYALNISATGNTITLGGTIGDTSSGFYGMGNVTLTSVNSLTLPAITTLAGKTVSATVTGAGNSITTSTINVGSGGSITLTADDLTIGGALTGSSTGSTLTLRPNSTSRVICVNYAGTNCPAGNFGLDTTELTYFTDGWNHINIGRSDSTALLEIGDSTFRDPVSFLDGGRIDIKGVATGTDNASIELVASGTGLININSSSAGITTAGQNIILTSANYIGVNTSATGTHNFTTSGGDIIITASDIELTGSSASNSLIFNAGSGNVTLPSIVNKVSSSYLDLTASGTSITLGGTIGATSGSTYGVGNVSFTSVNSLTLPTITTADGKNFNATVTGAGNTITTGAINVGTGSITLTADDVTIGGDLTGGGTLTLKPNNKDQNVCVNSSNPTYCTGSYFYIDSAEIAHFTNGWGNIVIGRSAANSSSTMEVGTSTWYDPVTFVNNYRTEILTDTLTAHDDASILFDVHGGGWMNLKSFTVNTDGSDFTIIAPSIYLSSGTSSITTSGGDVSFSASRMTPGSGSVATHNMTIDAGAGTITLAPITNDYFASSVFNLTATAATIVTDTMGGTYGMGNVNLTSTNALSLAAITTQVGKTVNATVTGAGNGITITGDINVGALGNITLTADDLDLQSGGSLTGTGTLTIQQETFRALKINFGGSDGTNLNISTAEIGRITDGWGSIVLGAASTGYIQTGDNSWSDPVTFRTTGFEAYGTVTGTDNASIHIIPGPTLQVNTSTSSGTNIVTAGGDITIDAQLFPNTGASSTINSHGGNITIGGIVIYNGGGSVDVESGGGNIHLTNKVEQSGTSASGKLVTLNAGTGSITLDGQVQGEFDFSASGNSLTSFNPWGSVIALGNVNVTTVANLTMPDITTAAGKTVNLTVTGAGNKLTTNAISVGTNGNITLAADDMDFGGAISGTGNLVIKPNGTNRNVCVNISSGSVCGSNNLALSTADLSNLTGGWSSITIGRADNTGNMEVSTSSWSDPVTFINDGLNQADGDITGTDDASLTFNSGADGHFNFNRASGLTITTNNKDVNIISGLGNNLYVQGDTTINTNGGNVSISTASGKTLNLSGGATADVSLTINTGGGSITLPAVVDASSTYALNLTLNGSDITAGDISTTGDVSLTATNSITLPNITANSIFAQTTGTSSNISLGGNLGATETSGDSVVLVSGNNFYNSSSKTITTAGTGRWLIYSKRPSNNNKGGLAQDFNRYSCAYNSVGTCAYNATIADTVSIPTTGNGFIYSYTPVLTVTPSTITGKQYGDTVNLAGYAYTLSGYLTGEGTDTVTGSLTGTSDYAAGDDIGTYNIDYASGTLTSALGYGFNYVSNQNAFDVAARQLTISLTGSVDKEYNGSNAATLTSSNYVISNKYGSDSLTITNTSGTYDNANAGNGKTVTVNGLTLTGAKAGNYTLASTSTSGAVGNISKKALTAVVNNQTVYYGDGTPNLTAANVTWSGFITGENSSVIDSITFAISGNPTATTSPSTHTLSIASFSDNNYSLNLGSAVTNGTFTINKAPLSIVANNFTQLPGQVIPTFTASYSGFKNGENYTALNGTLIFTTSGGPGVYDITPSGFTSNNYDITYVGGKYYATLALPDTFIQVAQQGGSISSGASATASVASATSSTNDVDTDHNGKVFDKNVFRGFYDSKSNSFIYLKVDPNLLKKLSMNDKQINSSHLQ